MSKTSFDTACCLSNSFHARNWSRNFARLLQAYQIQRKSMQLSEHTALAKVNTNHDNSAPWCRKISLAVSGAITTPHSSTTLHQMFIAAESRRFFHKGFNRCIHSIPRPLGAAQRVTRSYEQLMCFTHGGFHKQGAPQNRFPTRPLIFGNPTCP